LQIGGEIRDKKSKKMKKQKKHEKKERKERRERNEMRSYQENHHRRNENAMVAISDNLNNVVDGYQINSRMYQHYSPVPNTGYFSTRYVPPGTNMRTIGVIIPFFNEEKHELQRTLISLSKQLKSLESIKMSMHVLVIADGWPKASNSMKDYLMALFPTAYLQREDGTIASVWEELDTPR
jgi:hypothetical protein